MGGRGSAGRIKNSEFTGSDADYNRIQELMEESGYRYFGIRVSTEDRKIGTYFNLSEDMSEYSDTYGEKLNGTSAIELAGINRYSDASEIKDAIKEAMQIAKTYKGAHVSIVGGESATYGDDEGEIVINTTGLDRRRGARLIYKIK